MLELIEMVVEGVQSITSLTDHRTKVEVAEQNFMWCQLCILVLQLPRVLSQLVNKWKILQFLLMMFILVC